VPVSNRDLLTLVAPVGDAKHICSQADLEQIFRPSEDERARSFWAMFMTAIITSPPPDSGTEASFISFWDDNIRKIISAPPSTEIIRDSNRDTSTRLQRPDFGLLITGICTFRAEEKAPIYSGTHPKDELLKKLVWTYDPAPYLLGWRY
jgi:hypothetical protein